MAVNKKDGDKIANNPSTANIAAMLPIVEAMAAAPGVLKLLGMSPDGRAHVHEAAEWPLRAPLFAAAFFG
jgi:hypothetical protein